jgi:5-hydroxyisourate hydrolase
MTLSTHVLDATTGRPAAGVRVRLERAGDGGWAPAGEGTTGPDGRLRLSGEPGDPAAGADGPGVYRMTFDSGAYFRAGGCATFYPEVSITFEMAEAAGHYHVPLLLSPFAYSTYRGS